MRRSILNGACLAGLMLLMPMAAISQNLPPEAQARVLVSRINQAISEGDDATALEHLGALDDIEFERPASLYLIEAKLAGKTGDWTRAKSNLEEYFAIAASEEESYNEATVLYTIAEDNVEAELIRLSAERQVAADKIATEIEASSTCTSLAPYRELVVDLPSASGALKTKLSQLSCYGVFGSARAGEPFLSDVISAHSNKTTSVSFSPDGTKLVSTSYDGSVRVWGTENAQLLYDWQIPAADSGVFSSDGKWVAAVNIVYGGVWIWNIETGNIVHKLNTGILTGSILAVSPVKSELVTVNDDGTIQIWDISTGETVRRLRNRHVAPNSVAYSVDGTRIAVTFNDRVVVYSTDSGRRVRSIRVQGDHLIRTAVFDSTGENLIVGQTRNPPLMLNINSKRIIESFSDPNSERIYDDFVYAPDQNILISSEVQLATLNLLNGEWVYWEDGTTKELDYLTHSALSPDGKLLATGFSRGDIRLWRVLNEENSE